MGEKIYRSGRIKYLVCAHMVEYGKVIQASSVKTKICHSS